MFILLNINIIDKLKKKNKYQYNVINHLIMIKCLYVRTNVRHSLTYQSINNNLKLKHLKLKLIYIIITFILTTFSSSYQSKN